MYRNGHSRRGFLKKSLVVVGGAIPYFSWSQRAFATNSPTASSPIGGAHYVDIALWAIGYWSIREGGLPVSDVFNHIQTMKVCHLCVIAARLGRTIKWDPKPRRSWAMTKLPPSSPANNAEDSRFRGYDGILILVGRFWGNRSNCSNVNGSLRVEYHFSIMAQTSLPTPRHRRPAPSR